MSSQGFPGYRYSSKTLVRFLHAVSALDDAPEECPTGAVLRRGHCAAVTAIVMMTIDSIVALLAGKRSLTGVPCNLLA